MTEPTAGQPQVTATVSPPDPPRTRWGAIPRNLGRARTSTVVLALLFLAIGALWVNIRPTTTGTAPTGDGSVVEQPVVPIVPVPPSSAPAPEPAPTTAPERTRTTSEAPTTSTPDVPTSTETSTPFPTTTTEPSATLPGTPSTPTG